MASENNEKSELPSLEKVILAFQKGLARASQATNDASKHDPNFLTGRRTLFTVESVDIELSAGLKMIKNGDDGLEDRIRVDFNAPEKTRSLIKFIVESKPLELITGPRTMLSRLDPLIENNNINQFLVWFVDHVDEEYKVVPATEITITFTPLDEEKRERKVEARTDLTGRLRFSINPVDGTYQSKSKFKPRNFRLDMSFDWVVSAFARSKDKEPRISVELPIYKREVEV
jgi:hypothetical protein